LISLCRPISYTQAGRILVKTYIFGFELFIIANWCVFELPYGTTFSTQFEYRSEGFDRSGSGVGGLHSRGGLHGGSRILDHFGARCSRTAHPVQPQTSRQRRRHRLPVLSHRRRDFAFRWTPAYRDVYDLPLADLEQRDAHAAYPR